MASDCGGSWLSKDVATRVELLARSHQDVIAHDRYLDEKVRSLIIALSFLAVAGISLFTFSRARGGVADLTLDGRTWNAANVFFVLFLINLIVSLMAALAAVDPASHRPKFLATPENQRIGDRASVLYAGHIAANHDAWGSHVRSTAPEMERALVWSYLWDTFNIAKRTKNKERRLGDAQGFVFMAMVSLGYLGLVRLPQSSVQTRTHLLLVSGIALTVLLAPATIGVMRLDDYVSTKLTEHGRDLALFYGFPALIVVVATVYAVVRHTGYWGAVATGLASIFVTTHPSASRFYVWLKPTSRTERNPRRRSRLKAAVGAAPWHWFVWLVGAGVLAVLTLLVSRANDPVAGSVTWMRVRHSGTVLVCARLHGAPYRAVRVKVVKDGITPQRFPRAVTLGATGEATVVFMSRGAGTYEFQFRRQDTDLRSTNLDILVPSNRNVLSSGSSCPSPPKKKTFLSLPYRAT